MKKILLFGVVGLVIVTSNGYAAPAYGTKMPEKNKVNIGVQSYFVDRRDLEGDNGEMRSLQEFILLSYGLSDWLSLDLKGGGGGIRQSPENDNGVNYKSFIGGGYGFRMKVYEHGNFHSVWGFQHISIHPYSKGIDGNKHKGVLDDWQLSFLGSYDIGRITPYGGLRWSRMDYIYWKNTERNRIKSDLDRSYGLIFGTDIAVNERIWLNIEGNFIDAQAAAVSLNYKF